MRKLNRIVLACAAGMVTAAALAGCKADIRDRHLRTVPVVEARRLTARADTVVLDARPANAYSAGRIPGAANVRIDSVPATGPKDPAWAKAGAIIVYGEDGGSAAAKALTRRLMEAGYGQARLLEGGIAGWRGIGLPVEQE